MSHPIPYSSLSKGTLLIASPEIDAGPFFRAVILICEHGASGSFGLVINKPLDVELPEEIIPPDELQNPGAQVRSGGPLQPTQMMLIHSSPSIPEQTLEICKGVFLGGDLQFLQESASDSDGPSLLLCFGYAGWSPGQLEREFLSGMWFVCPASEKFVFSALPEKTWRSVLQEMGGKYATLSMIPEDLSLN